MSLTVSTGATNAATGGTSLVLTGDGTTIQNGKHFNVPATTNYATRQSATFKFRAPTVDSQGVYSRDKKEVSYNVPIVLASGKVANNVIRMSREVHPEMSAAAALDLNTIAAQLLFDSETADFWSAGSLPA
jgi:hypothetical protein